MFKGWSGSLEHALATGALANKLVDVTELHINVDQPRVLDYNVEYKTQLQIQDYYSTDAYRSSDHDLVIAELDFQVEQSNVELMSCRVMGTFFFFARVYAVEVPQDAESFTVQLDGGLGNTDLYLRYSENRLNAVLKTVETRSNVCLLIFR